jgi:uncharacterized protein YidB (DUF937 family)
MDVSSMLGGLDPQQLTTAVSDTFQSQGGVNGLLEKLRAGGLGPQVDSWVSTGSNEPVEPNRLGEALGPDTVNELSAKSGLSIQMLLPLLAQFLPMIIDHLTPDGKQPAPGAEQSGGIPDIGDLIGGVLGGGGLGSLLGGGR